MQFEWDSDKEELNIREHGLNFTDGSKVFLDYFRIERRDDDSSVDEERYQTIGMYHDLLFVVYTERGEKNRIFSVRPAEPFERRIYANSRVLPGGWERINP